MATRIADNLRGKTKPTYTPNIDTGDFVVVVNAERIAVTGHKMDNKIYYRHTGYPGGLKERTLADMMAKKQEEVLRLADKGMVPPRRVVRAELKKLKCRTRRGHTAPTHAPDKVNRG